MPVPRSARGIVTAGKFIHLIVKKDVPMVSRTRSQSLICLALAMGTVGCVTQRSTTTERTAVEQALLSQAAEASIPQIAFSDVDGKQYFVKQDLFEATDGKYLLAVLNKHLVELGGMPADSEEEAEVLIYPAVAHAAVDDTSFLIGFPEIPLVIPGIGSVTVPELALFGYALQKGHNRMFLNVEHADDARPPSSTETVSGHKFYTRWRILFLISFRTTDLDPPH